MAEDQKPVFPWFAIVTLKGGLKVGGMITEVKFAGSYWIRVDTTLPDGQQSAQIHRAEMVASLTLCTEASAEAFMAARHAKVESGAAP